MDATGYQRNARFVSDLGTDVLQLLAPKPDEAIPGSGRWTADYVRVRFAARLPD